MLQTECSKENSQTMQQKKRIKKDKIVHKKGDNNVTVTKTQKLKQKRNKKGQKVHMKGQKNAKTQV